MIRDRLRFSFANTITGVIFCFAVVSIPGEVESGEAPSQFAKGQTLWKTFVTPPQPKDKRGNFKCTSDRYVQDEQQIGLASWYGGEFHGRQTASGEIFNKNANTIAHLTLPMGTEVIIENPENGIKVKAKVNDCGPYKSGVSFDLSRATADEVGITKKGKATVIITVL